MCATLQEPLVPNASGLQRAEAVGSPSVGTWNPRHLAGDLKRRLSSYGGTAKRVVEDVRHPPYAPSGHYLSPLTSADDIDRAIASRRAPVSIQLCEDQQRRLATELALTQPPANRWHPGQHMFNAADAAVLRAMLLRYRPSRYVEIGSGLSTAVALDVADEELPYLRLTCIDPYAARLRSLLRIGDLQRVTLMERLVQEVSPEELVVGLEPNDVFFIDSSHVVKPGSDVCWLFLRALPVVPPGVLVHIHDIFWPFEYPDRWLRDHRDWTEIYLLHAFLINNPEWDIVLFTSWLWSEHADLVPIELRGAHPGSLWLRRR